MNYCNRMMKNLLLTTFATTIILIGCKKAEKVVLPKGILGTWELRIIDGIAIINLAPGNGYLLQFNQDSTYINSQPLKTSSRGVFRIVKNAITVGQIKYDELFYDNSKSGQIIQLQHDTLGLGSTIQAPDAGGGIYVRIK
jgi:hypothetical protein